MHWLIPESRTFLSRGYIVDQTPEERIKQICDYAESLLKIDGFSEKLYRYVNNGWYTFSTPVWCNFGLQRGLPISCYAVQPQDDTADILNCVAEVGMMSKYGGGTAAYFGNIRSRGELIKNNGSSSGAIPFMEIFQSTVNVISQGQSRRGNMAAYYPIDGGDFYEFMECHSEGHPIQHISLGVCIPRGWMQKMLDGDKDCRKRWTKIIQKRFEKGYPYIFFEDNVNDNKPDVYKDIDIKHSQLCSEILLPTSGEESFVCCLGSLNLLYWEDWKNTDAVKTYMYFLDAVMTDFINRSKDIPFFNKAHAFAKKHRAVGLGVCGWHSLLQSKFIPFESMESKLLNVTVFKHIDDESKEASFELAKQFGEPELMSGRNERFTTRLAIAPTTSSSYILGQVSQSIEPYIANYFVSDNAKLKNTFKNPFLNAVFKAKGQVKELWKSVLEHGGSCQHLDCLSDNEKMVFKTAGEISQLEIAIQAAQRQKYIDQGQSLNFFIDARTSPKKVSELMIESWRLGVKTLYYQRGTNLAQTTGRDIMTCISCE